MRYIRPAGHSRRVGRRKRRVLEETGVEKRKPRICRDEERKSVGSFGTVGVSTGKHSPERICELPQTEKKKQ
jgi:hypothetical protein